MRVGRVTRAHGLHGEVKILPYGIDAGELQKFARLLLSPVGKDYGIRSFLENQSADFVSFAVKGSRTQGEATIVSLAGITDRTAAESLQGREVWVEDSQLETVAENEFYWHEVEGMEVVAEGGTPVGRVYTLFSTPAHDVLVIRNAGEEYYIPANREFVVGVDRRRRLLTVAAVPGLLEMNRRGR